MVSLSHSVSVWAAFKEYSCNLHEDTTDPLVVVVHGEEEQEGEGIALMASIHPVVFGRVLYKCTVPSNTALLCVLYFNDTCFGRCLDLLQALSVNLQKHCYNYTAINVL